MEKVQLKHRSFPSHILYLAPHCENNLDMLGKCSSSGVKSFTTMWEYVLVNHIT